MKVLHLLKSNKYSGAENVVLTIMDACSDDIEMVYASPDGSIRQVVENRNHMFYALAEPNIREVKKAIHELNPDVIHAHDFSMSSIAAWASDGIPVISHLHNNPLWLKTICPKSVAYAFSLPRIKQVISVSNSVQKEYVFRKLMHNKNTIISNVVDVSSVQKRALDKCDCKQVDLVFLGRQTPQKNPLLFCQIVGKIKEKYPQISARMIGDGELENEVRTYINDKNLNTNIELVGFQNNPFPYLRLAKIMVMPSRWEGFGLAAIEGMGLGKPVICSGVGGLADIINDSCGAKCKDLEDYCSSIIDILTNEVLYSQKSSGALKRSEKYTDIINFRKQILMIYKKTMEKKSNE